MSKEQGTAYRKLFYKKYIPQEFWNEKIPDYSMCNPYEDKFHPIAEENKFHYKYKTLKTLRSEFNVGNQNFMEIDLFNQLQESSEIKNTTREITGNELFKKIASKISIIYIADLYGLQPLGKRLRVCPFHTDTNPSLSLNEQEGIFRCFGCNLSGNIILFYAMLKQLNPQFRIK